MIDRLIKHNQIFATVDQLQTNPWKPSNSKDAYKAGNLSTSKFTTETFDFYMGDVISKYSQTMARCVSELMPHGPEKDVAHG